MTLQDEEPTLPPSAAFLLGAIFVLALAALAAVWYVLGLVAEVAHAH